jgi:hypothetical protein
LRRGDRVSFCDCKVNQSFLITQVYFSFYRIR